MSTAPIAQGPVDVNVRGAITHGGTDRGYKVCRCHQCGEESVCTPTNDFYTTKSDDEPLKCEACFRSYVQQLKAPNKELSGPRPLAAEGSRSTVGLGITPGEEPT